MPHAPPRPFHASVDDTVVITYIDITSPLSSSASAFTLFIHRRTLLETVSNLTCADEPIPLDIRHQSNTADVRDGPDSGVPCSFSTLTTYSHAPACWRNLQEGMYDVRVEIDYPETTVSITDKDRPSLSYGSCGPSGFHLVDVEPP